MDGRLSFTTRSYTKQFFHIPGPFSPSPGQIDRSFHFTSQIRQKVVYRVIGGAEARSRASFTSIGTAVLELEITSGTFDR